MLTLVACTLAHLRAIQPEIPDVGLKLLGHYIRSGPALAALLPDGRVFGAAGIAVQYPAVGDAWAAPSQLVREHPMLYARTIRRILAKFAQDLGLHRIQTVVDPRIPAYMRWIEWLGFECETPKGMRRASFDGHDLMLYAKIMENGHGG